MLIECHDPTKFKVETLFTMVIMKAKYKEMVYCITYDGVLTNIKYWNALSSPNTKIHLNNSSTHDSQGW